MGDPVGETIPEELEFVSEGVVLRGSLYRAQRGGPPFPIVIMAHGTSATTVMVADRYAEAFAAAGISALLYDHRNHGRSDGEPRGEINPWIQSRGYVDAIDVAAGLDGQDPGRIGLWGDSYTGGQVFLVAAVDPRIASVVAQVPVFGASVPEIEPTPGTLEEIRSVLSNGDVSGGKTTGPLPVVSFDQIGTPSLLDPIQAFKWFIEYGGRPGSGWRNQVTRVIPDTPAPFSPYLCAPYVTVPSMMMVAPDDEMVHANPQVARRAFDLLAGEKEWYEIGGGHFGLLYHPGELFDEASSVQIDFLLRHL